MPTARGRWPCLENERGARFFSAFTTFGTPLDVTIASLRVELMFPADEATREALVRRPG